MTPRLVKYPDFVGPIIASRGSHANDGDAASGLAVTLHHQNHAGDRAALGDDLFHAIHGVKQFRGRPVGAGGFDHPHVASRQALRRIPVHHRNVSRTRLNVVAAHPDEQIVLAHHIGVVHGFAGVEIGCGAGVADKVVGVGLLADGAQVICDEAGAIDTHVFVHVGLNRRLRGILDFAGQHRPPALERKALGGVADALLHPVAAPLPHRPPEPPPAAAPPVQIRYQPGERTLHEVVDEVETQLILDAMRRHKGRRVAVCEELGITRKGLYLKLHRLGIDGAEFE